MVGARPVCLLGAEQGREVEDLVGNVYHLCIDSGNCDPSYTTQHAHRSFMGESGSPNAPKR